LKEKTIMSTTELQESIILKIRRSNDEELLNYLNQLLSDEEEQKTYQLSEFEKKMVAESEADYLVGRNITNELQSILHQRILAIDDEQQLSEMITFVDKSDKTIYYTTPEQKAKILEGQKQIAKGNFFTNEQVEKEIDEWQAAS
jgi:hypothetical protein